MRHVSYGQTIDVIGSKTVDMNSSIDINDPAGFAGQVNLNFASLVLPGVQADSYSLKTDLLSILSKGTVVDTVRLTTSGSTDPLKVYQTSTGVLVDNSNHGAGTLLPSHF